MYFYNYINSTLPAYAQQYKDNEVELTFKVPGIKKDEVEVTFSAEDNSIKVGIKGTDYWAYLQKRIDDDKIEVVMDLGILTITAPIKNTDKKIPIK